MVLALYFRTWTHTSDDSYIYRLSLVVATATYCIFSSFYPTVVNLLPMPCPSCDASLATTLLPDPPFLCTTHELFQDSDEESPSEASDPGLSSDDDDEESEDSPVILAPRKKQRVGRQVRLPARLRDSQVQLGGGGGRSASGGVNVSSFIDAASGISSVQGGEVAAPTQRHLSQTAGASNAAVAAAPGAGSSSSRLGPSASWRTTPDPIAVRSGSTGSAFSNTAARQGGPSHGGRTMAASGQRGAPSRLVIAARSVLPLLPEEQRALAASAWGLRGRVVLRKTRQWNNSSA